MCGFVTCCRELISFGFLNTLYPFERDPISHFKRLGAREQSLPGVRIKKKKNGVASAVGKPRRFTLVLQCLHGLPQEASPCPIRQPQRELSDGMFTQGPQRQSLFKLAAGEGGLTWTLNAVQIQNRKLPIWFP